MAKFVKGMNVLDLMNWRASGARHVYSQQKKPMLRYQRNCP